MGRATEDTAGIGRALTRALPPAIAAGVLWLLGRSTAAFVVAMVAVAVLALGLAAPGAARRLDRVLDRAGGIVARAIAVALSALTWVLVLLPVWALSRAVRYSPLDPGWSTRTSNWVTIGSDRARQPDGRPSHPTRMGGLDTERAPTARRRGHLRLVFLAPVVVVALVLAVPALARRYHSSGQGDSTTIDLRQAAVAARGTDGAPGGVPATVPPDTPVPDTFNGVPVDRYAHENEPWAVEHLREVSVSRTFHDYFLGFRLGDFRAPYLNVKDGRRVTYTPAKANLTVWFFGGSTMFGIGQRDDHTIPSIVAHLAERDGIRVNALNFGASGYVNFQETLLLAERLTELPTPDLVVFYDGANDSSLGHYRTGDGDLDPMAVDRLPLSDRERAEHRTSLGKPAALPPDQATSVAIALSAEQYRRGVEISRALADHYGFQIAHVWQPVPEAKPVHAADAELLRRLRIDPGDVPELTRRYEEVRRRSGVDPIDLTQSLDDVMQPVYFDSSHTNELGARVIATALYARIEPQLASLAAGRR